MKIIIEFDEFGITVIKENKIKKVFVNSNGGWVVAIINAIHYIHSSIFEVLHEIHKKK